MNCISLWKPAESARRNGNQQSHRGSHGSFNLDCGLGRQQNKFAIHWPDRILGPPLSLKGMNVLCWSMFVAFLVVPLFVNLWVQFKTGSGSIRKFDSDFVYFYGIGQLVNEHPPVDLYNYGLQQKIFNQIYPAHEAFYRTEPRTPPC